jgi:hypothetical protein
LLVSQHENGNVLKTNFYINMGIITPDNWVEYMSHITLKGRLSGIIILNVHAQTEAKGDDKDSFTGN